MAAVGCVVVYSYYRGYAKSILEIAKIFASTFGGVPVVVVATKAVHAWWVENCGEEFSIVQHNNIGWEFGAYLKGLEHAQDELSVKDGVIVLNDTVGIHSVLDKGIISRFCGIVRNTSGQHSVMIGEADHWSQPIEICGTDASRWIRSCLFYISSSAIERFRRIDLSDERIDNLVRLESRSSRYIDCSQCSGMAEHLNTWLIEGGVLGAYKPKKNSNLDAEEQALLINKGRSIVREKLLSVEIRATGGQIIDMLNRSLFSFLLFRLRRRLQIYSPRIKKLRAGKND